MGLAAGVEGRIWEGGGESEDAGRRSDTILLCAKLVLISCEIDRKTDRQTDE